MSYYDPYDDDFWFELLMWLGLVIMFFALLCFI